MKLCSIASGSSGNCIFAGSDKTSLLVDAGISGKRIEFGLNEIDRTTADIDAILITHEHSDHIKGLGVVARKYKIPIYATAGTIDALLAMNSLGKMPEGIFHEIREDEPCVIRDIAVHPQHPAEDRHLLHLFFRHPLEVERQHVHHRNVEHRLMIRHDDPRTAPIDLLPAFDPQLP